MSEHDQGLIGVGFVYFVRAPDAVKIGWSMDPRRRFDELQVGSPVALKLAGAIRGSEEDEKALHECFEHLRQRGEWFRVDPALTGAIAFLIWREQRAGVVLPNKRRRRAVLRALFGDVRFPGEEEALEAAVARRGPAAARDQEGAA